MRFAVPKVPNRYELLSCAFKGHTLAGTEAASLDGADPAIAREMDGLRWFRCLRCDAWVVSPPPSRPASEHVPTRDELTVPMRGPRLRDRYVLRLIAIDRAIHVAVLLAVVIVVIVFVHNRAGLNHDYQQLIGGVSGGQPDALTSVLGRLRHFFVVSPSHLYEVAIVAGAYAALEFVEMIGLWYAKRWAEYLTFLATIGLIPLEVDELLKSFSAWKITVLVINLAVAAYLLFAKRLFGLRGGERALEAYRTSREGWKAVDAATVEPAVGAAEPA
jgi:uncharacterized membrane protein (DUF2068 family)